MALCGSSIIGYDNAFSLENTSPHGACFGACIDIRFRGEHLGRESNTAGSNARSWRVDQCRCDF